MYILLDIPHKKGIMYILIDFPLKKALCTYILFRHYVHIVYKN